MISDLQGYHEGIIMGLDYPRGLFVGKGNGFGRSTETAIEGECYTLRPELFVGQYEHVVFRTCSRFWNVLVCRLWCGFLVQVVR